MTHSRHFLSTAAGLALLAAATVGPAGASDGAAKGAQGPVKLFQHVAVQETQQFQSATRGTDRSASDRPVVDRRDALVRRTQASLAQLGFEPGPVDGKLGPQTRRAIRAFQEERRLRPDGEVSATLLSAIASALRETRSAPTDEVEVTSSMPAPAPAVQPDAPVAAAEPAEAPSAGRTGGVRLIAAAEAAAPESGPSTATDAVAPAGEEYGLEDAIAESWTIMTSLSGAVVDMVQARFADATR